MTYLGLIVFFGADNRTVYSTVYEQTVVIHKALLYMQN